MFRVDVYLDDIFVKSYFVDAEDAYDAEENINSRMCVELLTEEL